VSSLNCGQIIHVPTPRAFLARFPPAVACTVVPCISVAESWGAFARGEPRQDSATHARRPATKTGEPAWRAGRNLKSPAGAATGATNRVARRGSAGTCSMPGTCDARVLALVPSRRWSRPHARRRTSQQHGRGRGLDVPASASASATGAPPVGTDNWIGVGHAGSWHRVQQRSNGPAPLSESSRSGRLRGAAFVSTSFARRSALPRKASTPAWPAQGGRERGWTGGWLVHEVRL
jgi:hypothetical protein